jgi:hypothetical protein
MLSQTNYKEKYLKYKTKYLELKNKSQVGGDKPFITAIDKINLFNTNDFLHKEMEDFLNPIYGLVMCESGYIENNFYLYKDKFISNEQAKKIYELSKKITGTIQPTNQIRDPDKDNIKPVDIGRYIALLYICKNNQDFIEIKGKKSTIIFNTIENSSQYKSKIIKDKAILDKEKLTSFINKSKLIKQYIPINQTKEKMDFHILLYCLWWVANNDEGIKNYYEGINEVFEICNKYLNKPFSKIDFNQSSNEKSNSFENIIYNITTKNFNVYSQEWAKHFCSMLIDDKPTYPDCGEVTARNLINLICYNRINFDIKILEKYEAIPELINYYKIFNDFKKQSSNDVQNIYGDSLNSRDAWSKLIINYAKNNIIFKKSCNGNPSYNLEVKSGMSIDGKTQNFFQLIKNLLPKIEKWDSIIDDKIMEISDNIDKQTGFGTIEIEHSVYNKVLIHCQNGHFYMEILKREESYNYSNLTEDNIKIIEILLNKTINLDTYLWIKWNSELLVDVINNQNTNIELIKKLLELSFIDNFDSDARRRIRINVDDSDISNYFVQNYKNNEKINDYTYLCNDFLFVLQLPKLIKLICDIKNKNISSIDLSPLSNIKSIDYFMNYCEGLTSIDLSPLSNIESIGNSFMYRCLKLNSIILRAISKIESIGNYFMGLCKGLTSINLSGLSNVKLIGSDFMCYCSGLTSIDLSPLSNIESIGNSFMYKCSELKSINLLGLLNLKSIGSNFMLNCSGLTNIDLSPLINLKSIDSHFMYGCKGLKSIDLSGLSNIKSIDSAFMNDCEGLKSIDLSGLSNVKSIDSGFMSGCKGLKSIKLRKLSKIESIGKYFMYCCSDLISIDLSGLSKIESIDSNFMSGCLGLTSIDLSGLSNVRSIDSSFMSGCSGLKSIKLSSLSKIESIGKYFMYCCSGLTSIDLSSLTNLKSIGSDFMSGCIGLTSIDLTPLTNLKSIGSAFMNKNSQVIIKCTNKQKSIILSENPNLEKQLLIN